MTGQLPQGRAVRLALAGTTAILRVPLGSVDLVPGGFFAMFESDGDGECQMRNRIGSGTLG